MIEIKPLEQARPRWGYRYNVEQYRQGIIPPGACPVPPRGQALREGTRWQFQPYRMAVTPVGEADKSARSIQLQDVYPVGQSYQYQQLMARRRAIQQRRVTRPGRVTPIPGRGPAVVRRQDGQTTITPLRPQWRPARGAIAARQSAAAQVRQQREAERLRRQAIWRRETELRQQRERRTAQIKSEAARRQATAARRRAARTRERIIQQWQARRRTA